MKTKEAVVGMIVARPITMPGKTNVLLSEGVALTEQKIARLLERGVAEIDAVFPSAKEAEKKAASQERRLDILTSDFYAAMEDAKYNLLLPTDDIRNDVSYVVKNML